MNYSVRALAESQLINSFELSVKKRLKCKVVWLGYDVLKNYFVNYELLEGYWIGHYKQMKFFIGNQ